MEWVGGSTPPPTPIPHRPTLPHTGFSTLAGFAAPLEAHVLDGPVPSGPHTFSTPFPHIFHTISTHSSHCSTLLPRFVALLEALMVDGSVPSGLRGAACDCLTEIVSKRMDSLPKLNLVQVGLPWGNRGNPWPLLFLRTGASIRVYL